MVTKDFPSLPPIQPPRQHNKNAHLPPLRSPNVHSKRVSVSPGGLSIRGKAYLKAPDILACCRHVNSTHSAQLIKEPANVSPRFHGMIDPIEGQQGLTFLVYYKSWESHWKVMGYIIRKIRLKNEKCWFETKEGTKWERNTEREHIQSVNSFKSA